MNRLIISSNLRDFWEKRFQKYGHTGYKNLVIYSYDQPLRLMAIGKVLRRLKIKIDENTRILDAGYGTGDLVEKFSRKGAQVKGVDIVSALLRDVKKRLDRISLPGKIHKMT